MTKHRPIDEPYIRNLTQNLTRVTGKTWVYELEASKIVPGITNIMLRCASPKINLDMGYDQKRDKYVIGTMENRTDPVYTFWSPSLPPGSAAHKIKRDIIDRL